MCSGLAILILFRAAFLVYCQCFLLHNTSDLFVLHLWYAFVIV
jgi:hypothetical protein